MNIRPLHDIVIIRRLPLPEDWNLQKGLAVPDSVEKLTEFGEVVAIGPGKRFKDEHEQEFFLPTVLKPGDKVVLGRYNELEMDNLVVCHEADVRCVVDG